MTQQPQRVGKAHATSETPPASYTPGRKEAEHAAGGPKWELGLPGWWLASSPATLATGRPAASSIYASQMWLAGGRGREQERSGVELSGEICAAWHGKVPALSRAGRWVQGCGDPTISPQYPAGLGRGMVQAHCSCSSLQEGSRGAFQDTRCAVVPGYCCVFFFFLAFTHRSWQFPAHSRNQDGPAQGQRRCTNTISIPLTASLTPCPAETQDTTCTDQMDLSSSSTPSPKPSSILHRVTPVPRSDPSCKYQSHQSRQSTAAESLGERHGRDSSQHGELSPRCSTLPAHTLCPGCHTEPLSPSY